MNALAPCFEFRMPRLHHGRARVFVDPFIHTILVLESGNLLQLQTLRPWECQPFFAATEVISDVTLAADIRAHLLSGRIFIYVKILNALRRLESTQAFNERWTTNAQLHCVRVVAVNAR